MSRIITAVQGIPAEELHSFTEELEAVETHANAFGFLESATIQFDTNNGTRVTATYADRGWTLTFGQTPEEKR